jgi:hypothetical protein
MELQEVIKKKEFKSCLKKNEHKTTVLQRVGFLMEMMDREDLASIIFKECKNRELKYIPLKEGKTAKIVCGRDKNWKVIINTDIQVSV